jgi:hypothetical protein
VTLLDRADPGSIGLSAALLPFGRPTPGALTGSTRATNPEAIALHQPVAGQPEDLGEAVPTDSPPRSCPHGGAPTEVSLPASHQAVREGRGKS